MKEFLSIADQYGLSWAMLIAVAIAYWLEVRDRNKTSVPISWVMKQEEHYNTILENQGKIIEAIAIIGTLVKAVLFGKGA